MMNIIQGSLCKQKTKDFVVRIVSLFIFLFFYFFREARNAWAVMLVITNLDLFMEKWISFLQNLTLRWTQITLKIQSISEIGLSFIG